MFKLFFGKRILIYYKTNTKDPLFYIADLFLFVYNGFIDEQTGFKIMNRNGTSKKGYHLNKKNNRKFLELIEKLKTARGYKTDREIADKIFVPFRVFSHYKNGYDEVCIIIIMRLEKLL